LTDLNKKIEEYDIEDGFAIYRGSPVNYNQIKIVFQLSVSDLIIEGKTSTTAVDVYKKELVKTLDKKEKKQKKRRSNKIRRFKIIHKFRICSSNRER